MVGTSWWQTPYEHLAVESREASGRRVAVVRFDLPERRNAMSGPMTASWVRLMTALRGDPDLAAVVVTGNGRAFNAGGDLSWIVSEPDASVPELRRRMLAFYRDWLSIRALEVPTIAAVNGAAIGAGLAVALACDIRSVATTARMGVPFTSLGLHPGMATTWSLSQVPGHARAPQQGEYGRIVDGQEAVALGLASRALPPESVLDEALAAADRVAAAAPVATRLTTAVLRDGGHATVEVALQWEGLAQAVTLTTDDVREGIAAAAAKRPPTFTGR